MSQIRNIRSINTINTYQYYIMNLHVMNLKAVNDSKKIINDA